jgi:hypothetical protein
MLIVKQIKSQVSVQAKNVNINVTDEVPLAFTMAKQIMRELSGAETEKEKVAVTVEKQCQQQLRDL